MLFVSLNKNIKMSSFKSSRIIQKKEGGPDRSVSDNQSSSVTLNKLAIKAKKKHTVISSFSNEVIYPAKMFCISGCLGKFCLAQEWLQ